MAAEESGQGAVREGKAFRRVHVILLLVTVQIILGQATECVSLSWCVSEVFFGLEYLNCLLHSVFSINHRLQALTIEANGAVEESSAGRRLTGAQKDYGDGIQSSNVNQASKMSNRKGMTSQDSGKGPTSLFLLNEDNFIRRKIKAFTEWSYPFHKPSDASSIKLIYFQWCDVSVNVKSAISERLVIWVASARWEASPDGREK